MAVYCGVVDGLVRFKTTAVGEKVTLDCNIEKPVAENHMIQWTFRDHDSVLPKFVEPTADENIQINSSSRKSFQNILKFKFLF